MSECSAWAPPKVVWLRIGNCATTDTARLLRDRVDELRRFEAQAEVTLQELGWTEKTAQHALSANDARTEPDGDNRDVLKNAWSPNTFYRVSGGRRTFHAARPLRCGNESGRLHCRTSGRGRLDRDGSERGCGGILYRGLRPSLRGYPWPASL